MYELIGYSLLVLVAMVVLLCYNSNLIIRTLQKLHPLRMYKSNSHKGHKHDTFYGCHLVDTLAVNCLVPFHSYLIS